MQRLIMLFLALGIAHLAYAAQPEIPRVALPLMRVAPIADGVIGEAEWSGAVKVHGLISQHNGALTAREGMFWVGCDGKSLFLAVRTEAPPNGELLTRAVPDGDRDIVAGLYDDSLELWIDPHRGKTSGDQRLFQIITNARGAMFDRSYNQGDKQNPVDMTWRVKWQFVNQVKDGWWDAEIAIPLSSLGAENDLDHPWGMRVVRDWQRGWDQSRWEWSSLAFEDVPSMPVVTWDAKAPVTQIVSLHENHTKPAIAVRIANPHDTPLPVRVRINDTWSMNPPNEFEKTATIAPGVQEVFTSNPPDGGASGLHHTIIRVTSMDGKTEYFVREFRWNMHLPAELWTIARDEKQSVDLAFKHYPYQHKMKVKVDISGLTAKGNVTGVALMVRKAGVPKPLAEKKGAFTKDLCETVFGVPELPDGDYEVAAKLEGGEGVPKDAVTKPFERKHFEWEHNKLGLSNAVIPPFTPLKAKGRTISCVLRDHQCNDAGLWDQIISLGQPVLAAPMSWEVVSGGSTLPIKASGFKVQSAKPHAVVTQTGWKAGTLKASVLSDYDYDGMTKVTLTVGPGNVDRLSLVIPINDGIAKYMHACGDALRYNYAGLAPAGDGRVWDSSKGNRTNIVGTFYPYIWLGGGERGLCWFADTDKDWVLDDKTPTIDLTRSNGVLTLRVHFITKPVQLDRPHTIVFGLQATPVKPMPEQPMNWRKWQFSKGIPGTLWNHTLGASLYYGCTSFDFYPRDGDFSIWDKISEARDTGKVDEDFVKRWIDGYGVKPGSDEWKYFDAHIRYTFRAIPSVLRKDNTFLVPYTNPRGIGFHMKEWPTFQDEWVNYAYFNREKSGGLAYEITPTRSFQDCALWYYKKMMTCFDGIYWDNIYMASNADTVVGNAWVDDAGRNHPGMGLFAMRELIKRTAIMFHEQGRPGQFIPHMTNTNIVPILSFANVNLDWEWQYGQRDFQDRFTPDLTVAETIGRQIGNVPLILAGGWYDSAAPDWARVMRTRLGVCLVHEIRVWDWQPASESELLKKLYDFGYGEKDCRVFNYWDEGNPVKVEGINAKTIAMCRGGKSIVVVTDYGEGGDAKVSLDLKTLGLSGNAAAKDLEAGEPITTVSPGVFAFNLRKHDFKAMVVE